jgi:hypothetical protein
METVTRAARSLRTLPAALRRAASSAAAAAPAAPKLPVVAQKAPFPVQLEAGKSYFWCACGLSAKQPFCDGKHKGSEMRPVK